MRRIVCTLFFVAATVLGAARYGRADESANRIRPLTQARTFHILTALPVNADSYQPKAAELVNKGIPEKFGHEEWAAVVLTNEIHQHVGIYTVLGAKMGVRAREILDAVPRAVNVTVETGDKPPLSCLIDGLQVALGSTFAQGLIHAPAREEPCVAAVFEYQGQKIRLALKSEVQKQIGDFIAKTIAECGNLTPEYFQQIETFSYHVWGDWDRTILFNEIR